MSSQWVNKFAIMRDLSLAQGCLPVDVAGAVGAGERPPTSSVKEDTEEEFYRQWVGDGDFAAPDLGLIKDMLEMVKNHDTPPPNENEDVTNVIQIRKLNPMVPEFIPKVDNQHFEDIAVTNMKKQNKKKHRNVAVQSLLKNIEVNAPLENKQAPILKSKDLLTNSKLDKPKHFNTVPKIEPKAMEKVVNWLQPKPVKTSSPIKNNAPMLDWNPTSMFKKKNYIETEAKPVHEMKKVSQYSLNKYVPSKTADEYYKKFVECSEMHRMVEENVWTKVERQMKEIDERRKAEAELFSLSLALCRDTSDTSVMSHASDKTDKETQEKDPIQQKLDLVRLPQHRHLLPAPCAVCKHENNIKQKNTHKENVDDTCNELDNTSYKTDIESSNSENKSPDKRDNVDDPWWNWRDNEQNKTVDENWRDKTLVTDAIDDQNHQTAKEPCNWRAEFKNYNFKPWQHVTEAVATADNENLIPVKKPNENESLETVNESKAYKTDSETGNFESHSETVVENTENTENKSLQESNAFISESNNGDFESLPSSHNEIDTIDSEKLETVKKPDSKIEDAECWNSALDDADEIDAWRFEILGFDNDDDDDDESKDNTKKIDKIDDLENNEASWQNEAHVEIVCNHIEKWRSILLEKEENDKNNVNNPNKPVMSDQSLESLEILSDSESD